VSSFFLLPLEDLKRKRDPSLKQELNHPEIVEMTPTTSPSRSFLLRHMKHSQTMRCMPLKITIIICLLVLPREFTLIPVARILLLLKDCMFYLAFRITDTFSHSIHLFFARFSFSQTLHSFFPLVTSALFQGFVMISHRPWLQMASV
jgi:hypothetical protein